MAHKRRAACSIAVILHVWYATVFQFDSQLGDFPFYQKCRVSVNIWGFLGLGTNVVFPIVGICVEVWGVAQCRLC